jgi:hypothetical protein
VGAAFAAPNASARARLRTILKLRDLRPTIHLERKASEPRSRRRSA